jgi:hypothetical protein
MIFTEVSLKRLYEDDYSLWLEKNSQLLRDRQLKDLDYENLIEELEALRRSERKTAESLLKQVLIHLLLYEYWMSEQLQNSDHWRLEIATFRDQLSDELKSKTIYNHIVDHLEPLYKRAVKLARLKSGVRLPIACPYAIEQILDEDWLPIAGHLRSLDDAIVRGERVA